MDNWRRYTYARGIPESEAARAKQQAFRRGYERLREGGLVGIWEDSV
jgi:hypothetical protein